MADVTIIQADPAGSPSEPSSLGEPSSPVIEAAAEAAEAVAEIEGGTAEEISSDAVEIARIQAERDKEIAETNAAVELAHIEARQQEPEEWREAITSLTGLVTSLSERVELLSLSQSIPQPLAEDSPTIQSMIPLDTLPTSESGTEPSASESPAEIAEVAAVVETAPARRRRRAI